MTRILSTFGFFRHGRAARPLGLALLTLLRSFVPNLIEGQIRERNSRNTLITLPVRNANSEPTLRPQSNPNPLTLRWTVVKDATGQKSLRMKWTLARPARMRALPPGNSAGTR